MKRIITQITAVSMLAVFTFAFAGENIADYVLTQLMRLTAKELVTPEFVAKAFKSYSSSFGKTKVTFANVYYQARDTSYESTPDLIMSRKKSYENFSALKLVLVASLKGQIHKGTEMVDIYNSCRDSFKIALENETPEFRKSLLGAVTQDIKVLESIQKPEFREELNRLVAQEEFASYGFDKNKLRAMLGKNATAEDITKEIKLQQERGSCIGAELIVMTESRDRVFEKFVLRRWKEGEGPLIGKYIELAHKIQQDVTDVIVSKSAP